MKKVRFFTLGCKVNQYETQAMRESVLNHGMREAPSGPADVVVINTCTVTEEADRENRYWIRRFRRENPKAKIVVTGCWVQRNRSEAESLTEVNLVLSNHQKQDLHDWISRGCGTPEAQRSRTEYGSLSVSTFPGSGRAFVKIQDGCNHACSFCKVVLVRGRSRSRPLDDILRESERVSQSGFREIVLTGIQLGAYGLDLMPGLNLIHILEKLSQVPGIERIRLSSIEPADVKHDLIQAMKDLPKVCPQLHIPLQSGDSEILKKMNRRYGRDFYRGLVEELRGQMSDFCLSMDVMAGFPGEEESHFQNTLSLIEETRPIRVHAFPYSARPGTRASHFENIPAPVMRQRMNRLMERAHEVITQEKQRFVGRTFPVLVEKQTREGLLVGHTAHYLKVLFPGPKEAIGKSVPVKLLKVEPNGILGIEEEQA